MLAGKKILLGISGGIAAYKTPELVRLLIKGGAEVKVVVTANALHFVSLLSLETVSGHEVYQDVFQPVTARSTSHISLADWADVLLVAPATANILGKFAHGIADDALSTLFMAFNKNVFIAPAMNTKMYHHFAMQNNMDFLQKNGICFIEPDTGMLACGYEGKGRMADPEKIVEALKIFFHSTKIFVGKKVLITAGPTHEAIDAVRFIGNQSSGLMGFSLAEAFAGQGAAVTLITGPTCYKTSMKSIERVDVVSAEEMYDACMAFFPKADITIMSAAVADYAPVQKQEHKIKKMEMDLEIRLQPTKDILAAMGKIKTEAQLLVGFALETNHEMEYAKQKLTSKNLDMIVLNSLQDEGAGFFHQTNKVTLMKKNGEIMNYSLKSKKEVAEDILKAVVEM